MRELRTATTLEERLRTRTAAIGVVGLGYVGLPLARFLADAGFRVLGYDVQPSRAQAVNECRSFVVDVRNDDLARVVGNGKLRATSDAGELAGTVDAYIICVPTPLDEHGAPDLRFVEASARMIAKQLQQGQLVILESTTYPGTTEDVLLPILADNTLRVGEDFFLAFSPERVDPGNKTYNTSNTPKVVGGVTHKCTQLAASLYETFITTVLRASSPRTAEFTKVLENTARFVNVSLMNNLLPVAHALGVDLTEAIDLASSKPYGFLAHYPGPGVGGHCIPVDPPYLTYAAKKHGLPTDFIDLAVRINDGMPDYVVRRVMDAMNERSRSLKGATILVLGVAYKQDIDDVRESPALKIIPKLERHGARVLYHDPHVPSVRIGDLERISTPLTGGAVDGADCVLILAAHSAVNYDQVAARATLVVDTRNAVKDHGLMNVVRL